MGRAGSGDEEDQDFSLGQDIFETLIKHPSGDTELKVNELMLNGIVTGGGIHFKII